jgi:hypothetical protein
MIFAVGKSLTISLELTPERDDLRLLSILDRIEVKVKLSDEVN